jgi:hypothetical protein
MENGAPLVVSLHRNKSMIETRSNADLLRFHLA